ncbi:FAD binding domain-containing protein [Phlyctema vagabunda]|uniref:FAD binding domain-containing protein n=1 Tax=Phlyctema vagabunda TaxID=108571 RepID=A0ABR4P1W6_9HELO
MKVSDSYRKPILRSSFTELTYLVQILVIGAGPSGLLLCLLLARAGIQVTLLDSESTIDARPRAAHYAPSAIRVLARAGVLDDVRRAGLIPKHMTWRNIDGTPVTSIYDVAQPENPDALTVLPLNLLGEILLVHAERDELIDVRWQSRVASVAQDGTQAWAVLKADDGTETRVAADYICGCDGANSQVRRTLFGDKNFPGKTWDAQIVATNVYYPFENFGYDDINFIMHPRDYYMAAKITTDGLWRVSYGEDSQLTAEEVRANQPIKFERMLPGHPKPTDYKLLSVGPYRIHQRCADRFRVGRICLAADAAHLCNPFGGMGLTGGIVDVGGLAECFEGIVSGRADDSILDKYDEVRRRIYHDLIDTISSSNFLRVSATDPDTAVEKDEFLALVNKAKDDPQTKRRLNESVYDICYDFTQHYNN